MIELLASSFLAKIIAISVLFVVSILSLPWLVAKLPEDYFVGNQRQQSEWKRRYPLMSILVTLGKNLLGYVLIAGGILMLFLPGQGVLTIVVGILLIDYPGKYKLEKKLAKTPAIFKGLNWLRAKANTPPLK